MRKYTPKDNVQAKAKYTDRFWVAPRTPRSAVEGEHYEAALARLKESVEVLDAWIELGQMVVTIRPEQNIEALRTLKEECGYAMCSELSAVDYLAQDGEFEIFYQLLNLEEAKRICILTRIKEDQAIESIVPLYAMAKFAEREMYDMFGIVVNNHPYLKRIIMPDDWEGHPLRKTYPLEGDEFASWYEVDKIFGKEYRDIIGPENRDPARIDRYDTQRFSRIGHEVPFGADPELVDETETPIEYSSDVLVDYNKGPHKVLDKRK
ncbi:NADH-quinone oxidoreductase subunit C [Nitratifractor sp.]|uniref:NADH-quinone oxidoreductase subunit C n=1 Tax=Nitratifractor sp. TaxID=2268144 RepID=UPI0025FCD09A|nr:NADH-quinone oxidoreductase subunit C [Nitratifractor sp.]